MASIKYWETEWGKLNRGLEKRYCFDRFEGSKECMGRLKCCSTKYVPDLQHLWVCVCVFLSCIVHTQSALTVGCICYLCASLFVFEKLYPPTHSLQLTDRQMDAQQSQHLSSISGANKLLVLSVWKSSSRDERGLYRTHWKCLQRKIKSTLKKKNNLWLIKTIAWTWSERQNVQRSSTPFTETNGNRIQKPSWNPVENTKYITLTPQLMIYLSWQQEGRKLKALLSKWVQAVYYRHVQ